MIDWTSSELRIPAKKMGYAADCMIHSGRQIVKQAKRLFVEHGERMDITMALEPWNI
jgi:hypothetical protein